MKLWKTTIVIWSDFDPREVEIGNLAREAESGDSYCSKRVDDYIEQPEKDPDWDNTEFFGTNEDCV